VTASDQALSAVVSAAADLSRLIPSAQLLAALDEVLRHRDGPDPVTLSGLRTAVGSTPRLRESVQRLAAAWQAAPTLTGPVVAAMLATGYAVAHAERAALRVEPVVTGPQSEHVPLRATRQVFEGIAASAQRELLVLTYSAHADPRITAALRRAADRGVRLRIVLETTRADGGTLRTPALDALRGLPAEFHVWAPAHRPALVPPPSMHAKGIVADRHSALLTSANLSGHAFDENVEVGVRIVGGDLPGRLRDHFDALIAAGVFVRVTPD
jgi:cardiolipin synthase